MIRVNLNTKAFRAKFPALAAWLCVAGMPLAATAQNVIAPSVGALESAGAVGSGGAVGLRLAVKAWSRAVTVNGPSSMSQMAACSAPATVFKFTLARKVTPMCICLHWAVPVRPLCSDLFLARLKTPWWRLASPVVWPPSGAYLPLDTRPGREQIFAVASERPLANLSRVLVRMEGAGGAPDSVTRVVAGTFPASMRVAFRHIGRKPLIGVDLGGVARTSSSLPLKRASREGVAGTGTTASAQGRNTGANLALLLKTEEYEEPEVLSGSGQRIAALTGIPASQGATVATDQSTQTTRRRAPTVQSARPITPPDSTQSPSASSATTPTQVAAAKDEPGLGAALKSLFGFGSDEEAAEAKTAPTPQPVAQPVLPPATTFALNSPSQGSTDNGGAQAQPAQGVAMIKDGENVLIIPPPAQQTRRRKVAQTASANAVPQPAASQQSKQVVPISSAEAVLWQAQADKAARAARKPQATGGGGQTSTRKVESASSSESAQVPASASRIAQAILRDSTSTTPPTARSAPAQAAPSSTKTAGQSASESSLTALFLGANPATSTAAPGTAGQTSSGASTSRTASAASQAGAVENKQSGADSAPASSEAGLLGGLATLFGVTSDGASETAVTGQAAAVERTESGNTLSSASATQTPSSESTNMVSLFGVSASESVDANAAQQPSAEATAPIATETATEKVMAVQPGSSRASTSEAASSNGESSSPGLLASLFGFGQPTEESEAQTRTNEAAREQAEALAREDKQAKALVQAQADEQARAAAQARADEQARVEAQARADEQAEAEAQVRAEEQAKAEAQARAEEQAEAEAQARAEEQAKAEAQARAEEQAEAEAQLRLGLKSRPKLRLRLVLKSRPKLRLRLVLKSRPKPKLRLGLKSRPKLRLRLVLMLKRPHLPAVAC